ncbi:GDP-mannose 4,6-dehydratase [Candidatus Pelagibacter sp.]|nr:GDP-mannose 4,6-dehydratase [Candidatus Pelagibacter sp.]
MKKKIALITGITGQDGSLLTRLLIKKNYTVHGIIRRSSSFNTARIEDLYSNKAILDKKLFLHYGDVLDFASLSSIVKKCNPDEVYNLGAQSHVKVSFELPEYSAEVDGMGCLRILEAVRQNGKKNIKFYQASTSEMFGTSKPPQNEKTVFRPASPYGAAKVFAHWMVDVYRKSYKMFASTGILFNHEGPERGDTFVTKKIVNSAVKIYFKKSKKLKLGNLYAKRDWGDARDYVYGMWKILQHNKPDDFVLATNKSISVKQFVIKVFSKLGIKILWVGKGIKEKGLDAKTKKVIIEIDKKYFRPQEVEFLLGDYSKAKKILKWKPKISLDKMIDDMLQKSFEKYK